MSDNPNQSQPAAGEASGNAFAITSRQLGAAALTAAILFAAAFIWLAIKVSAKESTLVASSAWPVLIWTGLCALASASVGGFSLFSASKGTLTEDEKTRFRLLALGGLLGFFTAILGLLLPFTAYAGIFSGGLKVWRENPAALLWTTGSLFGGLTVMFASMQLARGLERTNPNLRRLLYGYNAVFGSLLLVAVLGLLNVLAYTRVGPFKFFKETFDWTSGGMYTLSEQSHNTLANLKEPVKVYVMINQEDPATDQVENLLKNCEAIAPQLTWNSVSRDRNLAELRELVQKYQISEPRGLLVIYGKEPQVSWDFIKYEDVVGVPSMGMRRNPSPEKFVFKGENALMKAITYLREGKSRSVIYFTQGNGEMDFNDKGGGRTADRSNTGLGTLVERIAKSNYDVKELRFEPGDSKVPADADVVVVARPGGNGVPMADNAVKALGDYVHGTASGKKGKLMILLDVKTQSSGGMAKTGLEGLLQEFGVRAGDDRVLALRMRQPTDLEVMANPLSSNPVAKALAERTTFYFQDARTVEPAGPEAGGPNTAEVLIQTIPDLYCFALKDLAASPMAVAADLRKPENREKLRAMISTKPLPLAVTVAESKGPPPQQMPPGHPPMPKDSTPRMAVFGDANWVSNQNVADSRFGNLELFVNCLTWLRERPDIGRQAPDVERQEYLLTLTEEGSGLRLQLLPPVLMLLMVIGLAGGIWVVRRR